MDRYVLFGAFFGLVPLIIGYFLGQQHLHGRYAGLSGAFYGSLAGVALAFVVAFALSVNEKRKQKPAG